MNIAQALGELDLRPGATEQEIRSAYRTLVAKWHPDKHQNDPIRLREAELRIKNINRAFEALQKAGFRTEKPSGKGGQKAEKPKGRSQSKSPEPPEVPKDGRSEKKAQKRSDEDAMMHGRKSVQWPAILIGAAVLFAAGILAGRLLAPDNPPPGVDVVCSEQEKEKLEQEFADCRYWDWVDLKAPNQVGVRSLYEADVIFLNKSGEKRAEHWPKRNLINEPNKLRKPGPTQYDHGYRILFRSALSPELVVMEISYENGDKGIQLWNRESGLLFPLGPIPYVARKIPRDEIRQLGLSMAP
jgi:hypothetical protein